MTGIADLYLYMKRPYSKDRRQRLLAHLRRRRGDEPNRFVVLSWKRTGSNLLCGMLYDHPEILMHNELFNPIDIFTYTPLDRERWSVLVRDLFPEDFLDAMWSGGITVESKKSNRKQKAIGFKSFPEHWSAVRNDAVWERAILQDLRVKKIILFREDELAVYVSMLRTEETGLYLGKPYPADLKVRVDPAAFQAFLNNYRDTYRRKYKSPLVGRDTFWITYEQLTTEELLTNEILPKLLSFIGVDPTVQLRRLAETTKQADPNEDFRDVITNYDELEFCFRYSDVTHFVQKRQQEELKSDSRHATTPEQPLTVAKHGDLDEETWSILLPICSRGKSSQIKPRHSTSLSPTGVNTNRFLQLTLDSQHDAVDTLGDLVCWQMLAEFCSSLQSTSSPLQLSNTQVIVGIDVDDMVYQNDEARDRIKSMLLPCQVKFIDIQCTMYGKVCHIWNHLARHTKNDYVVLLGDDIHLLDVGWQARIVQAFSEVSLATGLPHGAACVCMNDLTFPGFPTFPVLHRWHIDQFGTLLPKQFVNQGGDPYLFELYSRFNAACFVKQCCLTNTIGGDGDARYRKHQINWRGHILSMGLQRLQSRVEQKSCGFVLDIVVPSFRVNNDEILTRIAMLRATVKAYVKFWFIVDNPDPSHVANVQGLAKRLNEIQSQSDLNYFITVVHYGENRGASYARNTGYNYSTADWILFLDDDVLPEPNLLDAYIGAVQRSPHSKVFVGFTELPAACNIWTEMLRTCNVGYFYSIAAKMVHPPWGVTANLMVYGSRHNPTIQFKNIYPKTGGGEDIDLVYQYKAFYPRERHITFGVPEAIVHHPWWNKGGICYRQITGWAQGDSLCISEWPEKTFVTFPNWIEHMAFIVLPLTAYTRRPLAGIVSLVGIFAIEHVLKGWAFYSDAVKTTGSSSFWRSALVAIGAGSVLSAQETQRVVSLAKRFSLYSICRRVDWFDGQKPTIKLDVQLGSIFRFALHSGITLLGFSQLR
jgi:Glycosyl transferase family 2